MLLWKNNFESNTDFNLISENEQISTDDDEVMICTPETNTYSIETSEDEGKASARAMFSSALAANKLKYDKIVASQRKRGRGRPRKSEVEVKPKKRKLPALEEIVLPKDKTMLKSASIKTEKIEYENPRTVEEEKKEPISMTGRGKPRKQIIPSDKTLPSSSSSIYEQIQRYVSKPSGKKRIHQAMLDTSKVIAKIGRGRPRKQVIPASGTILPSQCTSTPKPYSLDRPINVTMSSFTPIKQEISIEKVEILPPLMIAPKTPSTPPKQTFSYLLRSPESVLEDSSIAIEVSQETESSNVEDTQASKRLKLDSFHSNKRSDKKPDSTKRRSTKSLENALEELLDDQIDNDDELNEKLSRALENSRNEQLQKENRMSGLTRALENRRGQIQKEIELSRPRGRGRPKGTKLHNKVVETKVTVLTADDDFQDESVIKIVEQPKPVIKEREVEESFPGTSFAYSAPKILQRGGDRKSSRVPKLNPEAVKKEERKKISETRKGSLKELLKQKARKTNNSSAPEQPSRVVPSEIIEENEFVEMVFLDFD